MAGGVSPPHKKDTTSYTVYEKGARIAYVSILQQKSEKRICIAWSENEAETNVERRCLATLLRSFEHATDRTTPSVFHERSKEREKEREREREPARARKTDAALARISTRLIASGWLIGR